MQMDRCCIQSGWTSGHAYFSGLSFASKLRGTRGRFAVVSATPGCAAAFPEQISPPQTATAAV